MGMASCILLLAQPNYALWLETKSLQLFPLTREEHSLAMVSSSFPVAFVNSRKRILGQFRYKRPYLLVVHSPAKACFIVSDGDLLIYIFRFLNDV
jgi:hypothetical protein